MKGLVVLVLVLAGLAVAADRIGVHVADQQVAAQIEQRGNLKGEPSVDITGVPFLTQAFRGHYDDVRIGLTAADLGQPAGTRADVDLRGVHLPLKAAVSGTVSSVPIDRVDGHATLSYQLLAQQLGGNTTIRADGQGLRITKTVSIAGFTFPVSAAGTVHLQGDQLEIDAEQASAVGVSVPSFIVQRASDALDLRYRIPALPFGLQLTSVQPAADGVQVAVAADDVVLRST